MIEIRNNVVLFNCALQNSVYDSSAELFFSNNLIPSEEGLKVKQCLSIWHWCKSFVNIFHWTTEGSIHVIFRRRAVLTGVVCSAMVAFERITVFLLTILATLHDLKAGVVVV